MPSAPQRAILILAIVVAFTAAIVFVVRDSDGDSGGTTDTDTRIDSAVCETLATVPEYDLCREVVRCNERFSEELLGNDCKIRAFKSALGADIEIVSVTVALDETDAGTKALQEYAIEKIIEFNIEGLEEFGPDFEPLPLPEPEP